MQIKYNECFIEQTLELILLIHIYGDTRHDIFITTTAPFTNTILYSRVTLIESYETYILLTWARVSLLSQFS